MSRYRPPRTAGTPLITPEGEARLRAELHELWHVRRPQVTYSFYLGKLIFYRDVSA